MLKYKYTILWAVWLIIIVTLCFISPPEVPEAPRIPYLDKIAHFGFYFGYTCLFIAAFYNETKRFHSTKKCFLWAFITAVILGGLIELLQGYLTINRSGDIMDVFFNTFGTIVALCFMTRFRELFR